jgi:uncharacterized phage protein gp47/JayE
MTYGITPEGFVTKPLADIKTDLEGALTAEFGAALDLATESVHGAIVGIVAERLSSLWDLAEGVNQDFDPDAAAGLAQDELAALTGAQRLESKRSTDTLTAIGTAGTVLATGRVVAVVGTGKRFRTAAPATIVAATAWAAAHAYVVGDRVKNGANLYRCITAGTSAGSGGPTGTTADITDNAAHWAFLAVGAAFIDVAVESVEYGPILAPAGALSSIQTPVSGWTSATNVLDAALGRVVETDPALRVRREQLLRAEGNAAVDALAADVRAVKDVVSVRVFENVTETTDADGVPPHSFEVLVLGGADNAIAQAIWDSKSGGIAAHGTSSGTATDADGTAHTVAFTRPTAVPIYVSASIETIPADFPADGAAQIKAAIVAFAAAYYRVDTNVVAARLVPETYQVAGVFDVTNVKVDTIASPVATSVVTTSRQLATFDTSRIALTIT